MTALNHSTATESLEPSNDPLDMFCGISRTAERRLEVRRVAAEIIEAATACGWRIEDRREFSKGSSVYLDLKLKGGVSVVARVADHAPGRPIGLRGEKPVLLVTVGSAGCVCNAVKWLQRAAEEVARVAIGDTHRIALPRS